ncbi:MAG: hypothetical protein AAF721_29930 [Myxococcota bacterium]
MSDVSATVFSLLASVCGSASHSAWHRRGELQETPEEEVLEEAQGEGAGKVDTSHVNKGSGKKLPGHAPSFPPLN